MKNNMDNRGLIPLLVIGALVMLVVVVVLFWLFPAYAIAALLVLSGGAIVMQLVPVDRRVGFGLIIVGAVVALAGWIG